jgi:L-seryl-tRNA(Ser) seleniumtransferase
MQDLYRGLPSVDRLLQDERVHALVGAYSHALVVEAARRALSDAREGIATGLLKPSHDDIVRSTQVALQADLARRLRLAINATGVVIHTNLGRAPLSKESIDAVAEVAAGYSNLEYDLEEGERGSRHSHLDRLLVRVTGAEAGVAFNNNASALLLALSAVAKDREAFVSRGQAVEIGGGFRIPDVMRQSGSRLVEVGTTNRTYLADYEEAITPETTALLRVHSSNFRVVGFTHSVEVAELADLA